MVRKLENERLNLQSQQNFGAKSRQVIRIPDQAEPQKGRQLKLFGQNADSFTNHDLTHLQNLQCLSKLQTEIAPQDTGLLLDFAALQNGDFQLSAENQFPFKHHPKRKDSQGVMSDEQIHIIGKEAEALLL